MDFKGPHPQIIIYIWGQSIHSTQGQLWHYSLGIKLKLHWRRASQADGLHGPYGFYEMIVVPIGAEVRATDIKP